MLLLRSKYPLEESMQKELSSVPGSSEKWARKTYSKPDIVEYGSVSQVTQGGASFAAFGFPEPEALLSVTATVL